MLLSKIKTLLPAPIDGKNGVIYEILPSVAHIKADKDGNILTGFIKVSAFKRDGTTRTACSMGVIGMIVPGEEVASYRAQYSVDGGTWKDCRNILVGEPGGVVRYVYGVPGSDVSTVTEGLALRLLYGTSADYDIMTEAAPLQVVRDGQTGERGKAARFYYYNGYFDSTKEYTATDNQAPYVAFDWTDTVTIDGLETQVVKTSYYMLVAATNKSGSIYIAPRTTAAAGVWELMEASFRFLIDEAIFSNFAKLGAAIFSGDWTISQYGMEDGITSEAYKDFDTEDPTGDNQGNFAPNIAINFLAGTAFIRDGVFSGFVKKRKVVITNENFLSYAKEWYEGANNYRLDFAKCGSFIEIQMDAYSRVLYLPFLSRYWTSQGGMTQKEADEVRAYVGTRCIIYNTSGSEHTVVLTQCGEYGVDEANNTLYPGYCACYECRLENEVFQNQSGGEDICEHIRWYTVGGGRIV